jgi:hypothetical protein
MDSKTIKLIENHADHLCRVVSAYIGGIDIDGVEMGDLEPDMFGALVLAAAIGDTISDQERVEDLANFFAGSFLLRIEANLEYEEAKESRAEHTRKAKAEVEKIMGRLKSRSNDQKEKGP